MLNSWWFLRVDVSLNPGPEIDPCGLCAKGCQKIKEPCNALNVIVDFLRNA